MKTLKFITFFSLSVLISPLTGFSRTFPNYGVIYQLSILKLKVETQASKILNDETKKASYEKTLQAYLELKNRLDVAINQFEYEMNNRPRLSKKFDRINKAYRRNDSDATFWNRKLGVFALQIKNFRYSSYQFLLEPGASNYFLKMQPFLDLSTLTNFSFTDVLGTAWGIYKDVSDLNRSRVDGLKAILETLRLSSIRDLIKDKDEPK